MLANPKLAHNFDVVIASPVLETGFSFPDPDRHFQAVLIHSNGNTSPTSVVQSIGRLRSDVSRYVYVPTTGRKIGNGSDQAWLLREGIEMAEGVLEKTILKLYLASDKVGAPSQFVQMWAEFGAVDNAASAEFSNSVWEKLEAEGYFCDYVLSSVPDSDELNQRLRDHRDESLRLDCTRVVNAPTLDFSELETLAKRQTHTAEERAILERGKIKQRLGVDVDSVDQVKAFRKGAVQALNRRLLMLDPEAAAHWAKLKSRTLSSSQRQYGPDFVRHYRDGNVALRLAHLAREIPQFAELVSLAGTEESFTVDRFEAVTDWFDALDLTPPLRSHAGTSVASRTVDSTLGLRAHSPAQS